MEGKANVSFPDTIIEDTTIFWVRILGDNIAHSNLLIIDPNEDIVYRYDPTPEKNEIYHIVGRALVNHLFSKLSSFSYLEYFGDESTSSPEGCEEGGYCNAYCIREALNIFGEYIEDDIHEFVDRIIMEYRPYIDWSLPEEIEYRGGRRTGGRTSGGNNYYGGYHGGGYGIGLTTGLLGGALLGTALGSSMGGNTTYVQEPYPVYTTPIIQ